MLNDIYEKDGGKINMKMFIFSTGGLFFVITLIMIFFALTKLVTIQKNLNKLPSRIHLVPTQTLRFKDSMKISQFTQEFLSLGFQKGGDYTITEMPGVLISSFIYESENLIGVLYEHPVVGIFSDLCISYEDESSVMASSSPIGKVLDPDPMKKKIYEKTANIKKLFDIIMENKEEKDAKFVSKEAFAQYFEDAYAREMDSIALRGGLNKQEVTRIAENMNKNIPTEAIAITTEIQADYFSHNFNEACIDTFIKEGQISKEEWDNNKNNYIIIHDMLKIGEFLDILSECFNLTLKQRADIKTEIDRFQITPIDFFESYLARNSININSHKTMEIRKIGEIKKPVKAYLYKISV